MQVVSGINPQWTPPRSVGNSLRMASSPEEESSPCLCLLSLSCFKSHTVWYVSSTDCDTMENITSTKKFG